MAKNLAYELDARLEEENTVTAFSTINDAIEYVETALGEYANDYDTETVAREVTEWVGGKLTLVIDDDGLWEVAEKHDIRNARSEWDENGEGWYVITWSDGGMDWTSNGPVWFDDRQDLFDEMKAAMCESTETHLPYAEYRGDGDKPDTDEDDEVTEYMVRQGFGDYSKSDAREEMEDLALEYAANDQTRPSVIAKVAGERIAECYANGTADASDIISLRSDGSITKQDAEDYYRAHGWTLPKFGIR